MLYQTKNPHGGDIYGGDIALDFSANTNPFGTPPGVVEAVNAALGELHRYPDPYCRKLIAEIAAFEEIPKEQILCGNGAAELIDIYCAAVRPSVAVELAPTFSEYARGLERVGCRVERYPLRKENRFQLDEEILPFLAQVNPDVVFLCHPNNPTGQLIAMTLLERIAAFCAERKIRLLIDECFLDLSDGGESMKRHLTENPYLFLLKAFTKSYGMAGLRLGYCLTSDTALLARMAAAGQPWNVSSLAQAAGVAALQEGDFLRRTCELVRTERVWLQKELSALGFWVCPSAANFLLFQAPDDLHRILKAKKIAIRNCDNYHGLGAGWYRTAVRLHEENERLIQAIREG